jgi:hypothetical protein
MAELPRIVVRPPRAAEPPPEAGPPERSRLRRALVCPYCRDDVGREGALTCGRRGCGALYHRECWEECAAQYGGCAVYGCASTKANEVSRWGWTVRFVRLFLAAVLFPPRVVRAIARYEAPRPTRAILGVVDVRGWRLVRERANDTAHAVLEAGAGVVIALALAPVIVAAGAWPFYASDLFAIQQGTGLRLWVTPLSIILYVIGFGLLGFAGTILGFHALRALAHVLASEVGALGRADLYATFLGRVRRGEGTKKA